MSSDEDIKKQLEKLFDDAFPGGLKGELHKWMDHQQKLLKYDGILAEIKEKPTLMTDEMREWLAAFGTEVIRMSERKELHYWDTNPENPTGCLKPSYGPPLISVLSAYGDVDAIIAKIGPMPTGE